MGTEWYVKKVKEREPTVQWITLTDLLHILYQIAMLLDFLALFTIQPASGTFQFIW